MRIYKLDEVITFSKTNEAFGELSNMSSKFPLFINDIIIPSSEALYQAMRYSLFPKAQNEIIKQVSPMAAKMISKKYHHYSRQDWDLIKLKVGGLWKSSYRSIGINYSLSLNKQRENL